MSDPALTPAPVTAGGPAAAPPAGPLLTARGLALDLDGGEAVVAFDLAVAAGELVQLEAPVEACAAALRTLAGLARPAGGEVRLLGEDPHALPRRRAAELLARVGWLPREGALLANLTLHENLRLPLEFHRGRADPALVTAALRRLGLDRAPDLRPERAPLPLRRRVALARAMLLDDPLDDLDLGVADAVASALKRYARRPGCAVLVASPDPDVAHALGARRVPLQVITP